MIEQVRPIFITLHSDQPYAEIDPGRLNDAENMARRLIEARLAGHIRYANVRIIIKPTLRGTAVVGYAASVTIQRPISNDGALLTLAESLVSEALLELLGCVSVDDISRP